MSAEIKLIPSGSDLDTVVTQGFYYAPDADHSPDVGPGLVRINAFNVGGMLTILQVYTHLLDGAEFFRTRVGSVWGNWSDGALPQEPPNTPVPGFWKTVVKKQETSRINDAVMSDDPDLRFLMQENRRYVFRGVIFFDTAATPDFKYGFAGPNTPPLLRIHRSAFAPSASGYSVVGTDAFLPPELVVGGSGSNGGVVYIDGIITNGPSAGDLVFRWAQNTAHPSATIVRAGSRLEYAELPLA
jgi:hypothetical protein